MVVLLYFDYTISSCFRGSAVEPIEQPHHSAITERIQRIRHYLKSTLAVDNEASSVLYREKDELNLRQGQREAISEHGARWKHCDDSTVERANWHNFGNFTDYVLRNS
jgi:hypothetical protein